MHLKSYESFILADKQTDLFFKVSWFGFPHAPTVKTLWDQPISRVECIRIELRNLVFFHYLLHSLCNRASLSALQKKKKKNVAKKEKLGLTCNTVSLSASHPPAKSAVSAAPHNTCLCWFHMRGALFCLCPTCRGSASAEYSVSWALGVGVTLISSKSL